MGCAGMTGTTVVRVREAGKDRHGDPVGPTEEASFDDWWFDWNASYSNTSFQDVQITDVDAYVPRDHDVLPSDKVRFLDVRTGNVASFSVQGRPMWDQLQPQTGHDFGRKLVRLREVAGA